MKLPPIGLALAIASCLVMPGCGSVGVTPINSAPSRPGGCRLEIFTSEQKIRRPFQVLCLIDSRTGTTAFDDKTVAAAIEKAKPLACGCGADAILIAGVDTQGPGWGTWGQGKAILKAIRFTDK
jgi:hypothetical protein